MSTHILIGDCRDVLKTLPDASVHCCVTSPPYFGLRDYGMAAQIGLEQTPAEFVSELVEVFREVRRVLRDDGTLWLNIGDSYAANRGYQVPSTLMNGKATNAARAGSGRGMKATDFGIKPKDLIGIPWMLAFALRADGWYLRQDIIWSKPNPMPESVTDRCTKAHEYVFLFSKSPSYHCDMKAISEPSTYADSAESVAQGGFSGSRSKKVGGMQASFRAITETRNKRSVWNIATRPYSGAHFATMAPELAETCIKAGCPNGGTILDPFGGAGTTGLVADRLQRSAILIELNPAYGLIASNRISDDCPLFTEATA